MFSVRNTLGELKKEYSLIEKAMPISKMIKMTKRKFMSVALCLIMVFIIQLQLYSARETFDVDLEEVLTVGSLDDDTLFQWVGVATDSLQNIYITDSLDYSLKKFNSSGILLKKTGRRGQGPGEFLAPRLIDCTSKKLYVTDQNILGIHVFDKGLEFVCRIPVKIPIADFKVLSDDLFAIVTIMPSHEGKILIIDTKGEIVQRIVYKEKESTPLMNLVSFDFDSAGNIYLAYNYQDRIEKFSAKGRKLWSRRLLNAKNVKKKKISRFIVPSEIIYKDMALDRSENMYILGGSFSRNVSRDVYVLSPEGEYLTSFTLPESSHCIYIDDKNFLYSRANSGVTLKKYKLMNKRVISTRE